MTLQRSSCALLGWFALVLAGCARPAAAMFVPNLHVGVRLAHDASQHDATAGPNAHHGLHASAFVGLSFRPRTDAAALPRNGDASGLILAAPCDEDDTTCLDELAESQPEFASLRGDTP